MNISCLALDLALDALIEQISFDRSDLRQRLSQLERPCEPDFRVYTEIKIEEIKQKIFVREAAYNEMLNARIAEHGVPV